MAFQVPYARTDTYKYSFFPDTIRDWSALPAAIISSAESSEDPVARVTSLVRSFFLSSDTVFGQSDHDNRDGVWHISFKNNDNKKKSVVTQPPAD